MYQITIKKAIYTKTKKGTHKDFVTIITITEIENNLIAKMLQLKKIYRDFNYIIEFVKIWVFTTSKKWIVKRQKTLYK